MKPHLCLPRVTGAPGRLGTMDPDSSSFVEDTIHYILNALNREELKFLLSQNEEWKKFVADADLSREPPAAQARRSFCKSKLVPM